MSESESLDQELLDLVTTTWTKHSRPILLSALGSELSETSKSELRTLNVPLRRYLNDHLSDSVRVVRMSAQGGAAVPIREAADLSDEQLGEIYLEKLNEERPPRYLPQIWRCFRVPLSPNARRFVKLGSGTSTRVFDVPDAEAASVEGIEVDPGDIAIGETPGEWAAPPAVNAAIAAWSSRHRVSVDHLTVGGLAQPLKKTSSVPDLADRVPQSTSLTSQTGLPFSQETLLEALRMFTKGELARIQMPADIVLSILERVKER